MILEGTVTNVAAFGAFVDVGVHQDGLVHVSAMSDKFISDTHEVVRSGQVVKVKVMEVDVERKRIGLSLRMNDEPGEPAQRGGRGSQRGGDRNDRSVRSDRGVKRDGGASKNQGTARQGNQRGGQRSAKQGGNRKGAPAAGGSMADALRRAGLGG